MWANICYHVAICVVPFNLIMQHILKKLNFGLPGDLDRDIQTKLPFDMCHIHCSSARMHFFGQNY